MRWSLSSKWLVGTAIFVVVLIVASVTVGLTIGRGAAKDLPESEPEGTVQRYLLALQNRDYPLARTYLKERLKESCTEEYLREAARYFAERSGDTRIAVVGKNALSNGRVEVRVQVTDVNVSPPFGVNEYSHEEQYALTQVDGQWRLDQPAWPVFGCPDRQVPPKPPRPVPAR